MGWRHFVPFMLVAGLSWADNLTSVTVFNALPSQLKVNQVTYTITYPNIVDNRSLADLGPLDGITHYRDALIEIRVTQQRSNKESTVIHEMLHAISHEYKFKEPLTEDQVWDLEASLYKTFQKNQWKIVINNRKD